MSDSPEKPPEDDKPSAGELEAEGQAAMFGEAPAAAQSPATDGAYRVLARKYRPQTFEELIGQDAMVRTLANAIERGRIAKILNLKKI